MPRLLGAGICAGDRILAAHGEVIPRPHAFTGGAGACPERAKRAEWGSGAECWSVNGSLALHAGSLTRLNCAEFRDDANQKA